MNKIWNILQYAYLMIAVVFLIDGASKWNSNREQAYMMFGFAIFITLIFFFKRKFRKRIQEQNRNKN